MSLEAAETGVDSLDGGGRMAGMSTYPFKCDLCGGVTELAPTYGDFKCQHCGQVYVYDECHRIELSERQLQTLRDSRWIAVSERLPEDRQTVIACFPPVRSGDPTDVCEATFNKARGWFAMEHGCYTATHWMPLPEPPEVRG